MSQVLNVDEKMVSKKDLAIIMDALIVAYSIVAENLDVEEAKIIVNELKNKVKNGSESI